MSRLTLVTLIICSVCILGGSLGNIVWGQCKSTATVVMEDYSYGPYDACDSYVKNTFNGYVTTTVGESLVRATLMVEPSGDYGREFSAADFPYGSNIVNWWLENPVLDKSDHTIIIDIQPDVPKESKYWSYSNTFYTVHYYATQGQ